MDYVELQTKAEKANTSPTAYARQMVLRGYVRAPLSAEQMALMRQIAGVANNLNQYVKHLNSGEKSFKLQVFAIAIRLKNILDDCKKY